MNRLWAVAMVGAGLAVTGGCSSPAASHATTTTAPPAPTTTAPGSSTTSAGTVPSSPSTTGTPVPVATIQIVSNGVVIDLASRVSNLGNDVTDAKLDNPTSFTATLTGVVSGSAAFASASASSGLVSSCTLTPSGTNVAVAITLTRPMTSYQTAVGSGYIVQITFS